MSQFASLFWLALIVFIAALAATIIFYKRGLVRGRSNHADDKHYVTYSDFDRALEAFRREFVPLLEGAQTMARNTTTIGEKVIAAVKPIELALRDLNNRRVNLEQRADTPIAEEQKHSSGESGHAVDNVRLERLERQLIAVTDYISTLKQIIEVARKREGDRRASIEAIDAKLADIQTQIDCLTPRLERGENGQVDLAKQINSLVATLAELKSWSEDTARCVADLDQRFGTKVMELEERLSSVPDSDDPHVVGADEVTATDSKPKSDDKSIWNDGSDDENDGGVIISMPSSVGATPKTDECSRAKEITRQKGHRIAPEGRGGGSRGERETTDRGGTRRGTEALPKVELIATRDSGDWQIFVEAETVDPSKLRVTQGADCIVNTSHPFQFGPLHDLTTPLQIFFDDVEVIEKNLITGDAPILYFRFRSEFAREVCRPSRGLNLAVVPDRWEYNEAKSGSPPIEPEAIGVPGYRVHFLSADTSATIVFDRPGETPFEVKPSHPSFLLTGHHLPDAEEEMGPLFGGELPLLQADKDGDLAKIHTIVVGVEGRGSGRWRDKCQLNGSTSWDWQQKVRMQGSGWYFLRLYDSEDDLIDSLDFRYVKGLKRIESVLGEQALNREHVFIEFVHDENVSVNFMEKTPHLARRSVQTGTSTAFTWPIDSHFSKVCFAVRDGEQDVRVSLDTDRIWWALINKPQAQALDWQLSAIELDRDDFAPMSNAALLFRFPRQAKLRAFIGFDRSDRRELTLKSGDQSIIYLNAFSDSIGVEKFGPQTLKLWVLESGGELEFIAATLSIARKCLWCESWMNGQEEMFDHVLSQHHDHCFERLVLKGEGVSKAFFVCLVSGCGQYYPESFLPDENPIARLDRHANQVHSGTMKYRKVDSPQDIRNLSGLREKWVWKCNLGDKCRPITPSARDESALPDKKDHLKQEHFNDLFARNELGK